MADEDFIVRLELDVRDAVGSAAQLANALARVNEVTDSPSLRNAERNLGKFAGTAQSTSQGVRTLNGEYYKNEAALSAASKQNAIYNQYLYDQERAQDRANQGLANTRYALYDVSQTATVAGAALLAIGVAVASTAIQFERNFADVVRTSQVSADAVAGLRAQFINLAQTIPLSFEDITKIGTLGGQLGIAADDLTAFTRTVAEFSAVTGVSVEAAGTAFGRLNALLPDVKGNFSALGSAIALVGVESVATEAEIIKTATQLSAVSKNAGLTSKEVIGLAGAFASIGVSPELARGTAVRVFTLIGRAAGEGGDKLNAFAKIAGVSGQELANAYGTDRFGPIFQKFLAGLNSISEGGGDLNATLSELGINSVRDRPALINLATALGQTGEAGQLVQESIANANKGFRENSELGRQYGIITGTVAEKLNLLANNFQVFLDAIGDSSTGPIASLVDSFISILRVATDIANNPVGQWVSTVAIGFTALLGVLLLAGAALVAGYAGILAMQQALVGLNVSLVGGQTGLAGLTAQLLTTGTAGTVAARGIQAASIALKGLTVIGIAAGLALVVEQLFKAQLAARGFASDFDSTLKRVQNGYDVDRDIFGNVISQAETLTEKLKNSAEDANLAMGRAFGTSFLNGTPFLNDLARVDEGLRDIAGNGGALDAARQLQVIAASFSEAGRPAKEFEGIMVDSIAALKEQGFQFERTKTGLLQIIPPTEEAAKANGALATSEEIAAEKAQALADQLGLSGDEYKSFLSDLASGSAQFVDFGDIIQRVQDKTRGWAEQQSKETYGAKDSWQEFYDGSSVNIYDFMAILDEQIAAQQVWANDLSVLAARGADGFVAQIAKMGPEAAPLAAAAVNLTTDELNKLESQARLAAFLGSAAFAEGFTSNNAALKDAYAKGGLEAVQALIDAQVSKSPEAISRVISQFNLDASKQPIEFQAGVNLNEAQRRIDSFLASNSGRSVSLGVGTFANKPVPFASGGAVRGPGTGTSDSINARLSNGEYVIKASSVRQYGTGLFDRLNRGVAKFASGGYVGKYASGGAVTSGGGITMVQLDARSLSVLDRIASQPIVLSSNAVAGAANASNLNAGSRGAY